MLPGLRLRLDHAMFDLMQRAWPRVYQPFPVRIVDVDEDSLTRLGQWPWPRHRLAALLDRIGAANPAVIVLDVILAEPDRMAPRRWASEWDLPANLVQALGNLPDPDAVLAESIAAGRVVTGFAADPDAPRRPDPALKARFVRQGASPIPSLPDFGQAIPSLPALEQAALGNGAIAFLPDGDGVIRRVPLLARLGETLYPALSLEGLRVALGASNILVRWPEAGVSNAASASLALKGLDVPLDRSGTAWLHYTNPVPERFVPAWRVLDGSAPVEALAGSVVFVASSAKGLFDLRVTSLGDLVPGVVMHAEAVEGALLGGLLARPDWMPGFETLAGLILALLAAAAAARLSPALAALALCGCVMLLAVGGTTLFLNMRLLADPLPAALVAILAWASVALVRHRQTEADRRFVRATFSRYVSPNLVKHLLEHPDALKLGGERRHCSFVMTDLAGFTGLVERADDAAALVRLLDEYIDAMVSIAFTHQGTLDRIVGDAVAVIFSAPVVQDDHAARAVACALDMDRFSQDFIKRKAAEGMVLGITRIGVHSGVVLVGNIGGGSVSDYRALGDAINVAARLETVNRHLGTRICVSAAAAEQCPNFSGRPVGRLILKGKSQGIACFEPVAPERRQTPEMRDYLTAYERLESGDDAGAQALFAALAPTDPLAAFHLARLAQGEGGTEITMAEK